MTAKTMGKKALALLCAVLLCMGLFWMGMPVSAAGVNITQTIDSVRIGDSITLSAGQEGAAWTSSNDAVATVDQNGVVTGHSMGKATITASYGGQSDSCTVSVGFLNGIDVSQHNVVDWDAVAASGVDFVMIRAGYGVEYFPNQNDDELINNIRGAYEHGIPYGLYLYSYAGTGSTETHPGSTAEQDAGYEAEYMLQILNMNEVKPYLSGMKLPIAYDLEEKAQVALGGSRLTGMVEIFANTLRNAGYSTMVYTMESVMETLDLNRLTDQGIGIWLARWPNSPDFTTQKTIGSTGVVPDIWQYASDGRNPGVGGGNGDTDLDLIYLDLDSAKAQMAQVAQPEVTTSGNTATVHFAARTPYVESYTVVRVRGDQVSVLASNLSRSTIQYTDNSYQAGDRYFINCNLNSMFSADRSVYYGLHPGDWDLNGDLNVTDVMSLAQAVLDPSRIPNNGYSQADWDGNSAVNVMDVMSLAQQVLWY